MSDGFKSINQFVFNPQNIQRRSTKDDNAIDFSVPLLAYRQFLSVLLTLLGNIQSVLAKCKTAKSDNYLFLVVFSSFHRLGPLIAFIGLHKLTDW